MDADAPIPLEPERESPLTPAPAPVAVNTTAVSVRDVVRVYRAPAAKFRSKPGTSRTALDGVSLDVAAGQWVALLGPNGSGKSTLFRLLATLDHPDQGTLSVFGRSTTTDADRVRSSIGVVFQRPGLDPLLTVRENLVLQGELCGLTRADGTARAATLGVEMGFADRLDDRVKALSGGLARRVDLARALLPQPRLLLLDEPSAGLDIESRRAFLDLLAARRAATGLTILMSTHQIDEAERADEVVMLAAGKVVAGGSPTALRAALGGRLVEAPVDQTEVLREAGLRVERVTTNAAYGAGDDASIERACRVLLERSVWFSVSPPTLADVYLARTGATLGEAAATQEAA